MAQKLRKQGFTILLDPQGDGNCQFAAVADQLKRLNLVGKDTNVDQIKNRVIEFLERNDYLRSIYRDSRDRNLDTVIELLRRTNEYGDELTLFAISNIYGIQIIIIKAEEYGIKKDSDGNLYQPDRLVNAGGGNFSESMNTILLGFADGGAGDAHQDAGHYFSITIDETLIPIYGRFVSLGGGILLEGKSF